MSYTSQLNLNFTGVANTSPVTLADYGLAADATSAVWAVKNNTLNTPEYVVLRMATPVYAANGKISVKVNSDPSGNPIVGGSFGTQHLIQCTTASGATLAFGLRRDDGLLYISKTNSAARRRGNPSEFRSTVGLTTTAQDGFTLLMEWYRVSATQTTIKGTFTKGGTTKIIWWEDSSDDPLNGALSGSQGFGFASEWGSLDDISYTTKIAGGSLSAGEIAAYVRHADSLYVIGTLPDGGAISNVAYGDYTYTWRIRPAGKTSWRTVAGSTASLLITGLHSGTSWEIERIASDGSTTATASLTASTLASGEVTTMATGTSIVEGQANGYADDSPYPTALATLTGVSVAHPSLNFGIGASTPTYWFTSNPTLFANLPVICGRYNIRYTEVMYGTNSAQYTGNSGWRTGAEWQSDMVTFTAGFRAASIRSILHEDPARYDGGANQAAVDTQLGTDYPAAVGNLVTLYTPLVLRGQTTAFNATSGNSAYTSDNVHLSTSGAQNGRAAVATAISDFWAAWKTANAIVISDQPDNLQTFLTATPSISVVATGGQTLSYQAQVSTDGGSTWANVSGGSGATTNTYTLQAVQVGDDAKLWSFLISAEPGNVVRTNEVTLTLSGTVSGVSLDVSAATVLGGATVEPTATVNGSGSPSQAVTWTRQSGPADGGIDDDNSNSPTITAPGGIVGSTRVVVWRATSDQNNAHYAELTITVQAATSGSGGTGTRRRPTRGRG